VKFILKFFPALLMLLALANALLLFVHRVMTNGDNLDYLFIAGSVLGGDWAEPFLWRFPVGYPFLIAAFSALAGLPIGTDPLAVSTSGLYAIQLLGVAMAPIAVLAVWWWCRAIWPASSLALVLVALFATTQQVAPVYSIIGAEPVFIVLSWLAIGSWEKAFSPDGRVPRTFLLLAPACTLLAILFRQIGMALPLAVLVRLLFMPGRYARRDRLLLLAGAGFVFGAGLLLMLLSNPSHLEQLSSGKAASTSLAASISEKIALLRHNAQAYQMTIPDMLLPKVFGGDGLLARVGVSFFQVPLAVALYLFILTGLVDGLTRRPEGLITTLYVLISVAIFLVWPYTDGRFFVPLIPALWMLAIAGFLRLAKMLWPSHPVGTPSVVAVLSLLVIWQLATNAYAGAKNIQAIRAYAGLPAWHPDRYERTGESDFADHLACGLWLAGHSESDAVVFGEKSAFLALSSGRRAFYLRDFLSAYPADMGAITGGPVYVVVDGFPLTAGYGKVKLELLDLMARQDASRFNLVFQGPHGARVFRLAPTALNPP
jgi:hypothetical protein